MLQVQYVVGLSEVRRNHKLHETLIPAIVKGIGAETYLEFGTYVNSTIEWVKCETRVGVDIKPVTCDGATMYQMTTKEFIDSHAYKHAPYDVVFIDADHNAKAVLADLLGIWHYVAAEGLVFLHDTNPEKPEDTSLGLCGDAWLAASKIAKNFESVTLPYHPGLTIIRKRGKWGPE